MATPSRCPNCGTRTAQARFCPTCGQRQGPLVPSVGEWLRDALEETLFVEKRLPRTLRRLVWPPGELTREWRRGRRASFVHPLRLYLLAAAVFFVPWSMTSTDGGVTRMLVGATLQTVDSASVFGATTPPPLEPLPPEQARDPRARAEWRSRFESRRAELRQRFEAVEQRVNLGLQRVTDVLPVLLGVVMIPLLALATHLLVVPRPWQRTREGGRGRHAFMEHLVLSTHVHAFGLAFLAPAVVVAALGDPVDWAFVVWMVALAGVVIHFLAAFRRNFRPSALTLVVGGLLVPPLYFTVFLFLSFGVVRLLVSLGLVG